MMTQMCLVQGTWLPNVFYALLSLQTITVHLDHIKDRKGEILQHSLQVYPRRWEICTLTSLINVNFGFDIALTDSGETLVQYFSGTVDVNTEMRSLCLLSAFLTWYNVPHPNTLAEMGITGEFLLSVNCCRMLSSLSRRLLLRLPLWPSGLSH